MSMLADEELCRLFRAAVVEERVTCVIETGTYNGLGSTKFVAESFPSCSSPRIFVTCEANYVSWREAKKNLARFSFVRPLWGLSVRLKQAIEFIRNDKVLINHRHYDDIFIDVVTDPIGFYTKECRGGLRRVRRRHLHMYFIDRIINYDGEGLLEK